MKTGDRVYGWMLRAFSPRTRRHHGDDMAAHVREKRAAASGHPLRLIGVWIAAAIDAAWHGLLDRFGVAPSLTTTSWRERMQTFFDVFRAMGALLSGDVVADVRLALRRLIKSPGFAAAALITLALGVGANSAIFSVVHSVLLQPLPFPQSDRLVSVAAVYDGDRTVMSPPNFIDLQSRTKTLSASAAYDTSGVTLTDAGDPSRLTAAVTSAGFFDVLGTAPQAGRVLQRADNTPGQNDVVVISHALWQSTFGGRADMVGRRIVLDSRPHEVVGVMPKNFEWPLGTQIWLPAEYDDSYLRSNRGAWQLDTIGRLAPDATLSQAQSEIAAIGHQLEREFPDQNEKLGAGVQPLLDSLVGDSKTSLLLLFGAVGFVLLIACVNVANLLLARASERQNEFAVRSALGAGRVRLIRQLFVESVTLSIGGALLGLALAKLGTTALVAMKPTGIARINAIGIDAAVAIFTLGVAVFTGLLFGVIPAMQASRATLTDSLRERNASDPAGIKGRRTRAVLVVAEVALAVMLVTGAGLLIRSFSRLVHVDPGFDPSNAVTFAFSLPSSTYDSDEKRLQFHERLRGELQALPGAKSVASVLSVPPFQQHFNLSFTVEGRPPLPPAQQPTMEVRLADARYFSVMGIRMVKGRGFTDQDRIGAPPVLVLTEKAARTYFANEDPLGKQVTLGWRRGDSRVGGEVIGIVSDVKSWGLDEDAPAQIYVPFQQVPIGSMSMIVRTNTRPETMLSAVRAAAGRVDAKLPITRLETLEEHVSRSVAQRRFYMLLLGAFAAVALVLAAIGIFGVLSYLVSQRTREIGIRVALGASRGAVIGMVVRQALTSAVVGVVIGLLGAALLSRSMTSMLFELAPTDPITFASVASALLLVSLLAAWLPARRAVNVDPTVALRQ